MTYGIKDIQGIGPSFAEKLAAAEIKTADELLARCASAPGRQAVSEQTGVSSTLLLRWCNMADLMRISGIGPQYAELLEASGVDTLKELRTRNVTNLATRMKEVNAARNLARTSPSPTIVEAWIKQAWNLQPTITY